MSDVPQIAGRYRVDALLGQGAMADVYRAYDPSIDRVLAIKVLKEEYRRDPECAERFLREARAAGALSHANIMTIYDVGESDGQAYIAMELIDGEPLDKVCGEEGRFSPDEVTSIGLQLAQALDYAHKRGVIHRDIKPSNIMLAGPNRQVKILDFGIARVAEVGAGHETSSLKTQIGQVLGTPRYMSPEQALGKAIDGRSDLFSVGAVLYELATGKKAFNAPTAVALAMQIATEEPPSIAAIEKTCPLGLQFIIGKLLAKRPEKRFDSGAHLAQALEREQRAQASLGNDVRGRRLSLPLRSALGMAALTGLVLFGAMNIVLDRQYKAMEHMALTSGAAISSFVVSNASLTAADNAALPAKKRDWRSVEAFVQSATSDKNVQALQVVDADGVIRGSSDPSLVGTRYQQPRNETLVEMRGLLVVTSLNNGREAFRLTQPIVYAGRKVGAVELVISKNELLSARALSASLFTTLGAILLLVVVVSTFFAARMVSAPLGRLSDALKRLAAGDVDFRISHARKDEFGAVFDLLNRVASTLEDAASTTQKAESPADISFLQSTAASAFDELERTRLLAPPANGTEAEAPVNALRKSRA